MRDVLTVHQSHTERHSDPVIRAKGRPFRIQILLVLQHLDPVLVLVAAVLILHVYHVQMSLQDHRSSIFPLTGRLFDDQASVLLLTHP